MKRLRRFLGQQILFFGTRLFLTACVSMLLVMSTPTAFAAYQYNSFEEFQKNMNGAIEMPPKADEETSIALSSSMLNMLGPLAFSIIGSSEYGVVFNMTYSQLLNTANALFVEGNLGAKENRINLTLGHAFSQKNRIKLSAERLAQKQNFNFDSGAVDEWVSQYAGGLQFQHLLGQALLNNISLGGYYAQSLNKDLDTLTYDQDGQPWLNYRRIAGARSLGGNIGLGLRPWQSGMITLTAYYDSVNYSEGKYVDISSNDASELGFGLTWNQYVSDQFKTKLAYSHRALNDTVEAVFSWFVNIFKDTRALAFTVSGQYISGDDDYSDTRFTLGVDYHFEPIKDIYTMPEVDFQSLKNWTAQPAVRMDRVLAAVDQKSIAVSIDWPSAALNFQDNGDDYGAILSETITWIPDAASTIDDASPLTYHLTVSSMTAQSRQALSPQNVIFDKDVTGSSAEVSNVSPNQQYTVQMKITDPEFGVNSTYSDTFTTGLGQMIGWSGSADAAEANIQFTANPSDMTTGTISWTALEPSSNNTGDPVTYYVTIVDSGDQAFLDYDPLETAANTHELSNLVLGETYTVTIEAANANDQPLTSQPYQLQLQKGEMTGWANGDAGLNFESSSLPGTGELTWNIVTVAQQNDTVYYRLIVTQEGASDAVIDQDKLTAPGYTVAGLAVGKKYYVTLEVYDANNLYDILSDSSYSFVAGKGTLSWQNGSPDVQLTQQQTAQDQDPTAGTLSWNIVRGDNADISYLLTISDTDIENQVVTQDAVQDGRVVYGLGSGTLSPSQGSYQVTLTAVDSHKVYNDLTASVVVNPEFGTMMWQEGDPNITIAFGADQTSANISWNTVDTSSMVDSDTVTYTVTVKRADVVVLQERTSHAVYTVDSGTLTPNTEYQFTITAADDHAYYHDLSASTTASTSQPQMSWTDNDVNIQLQQNSDLTAGTLSWNAVDPDSIISGDSIQYTMQIKQSGTEILIGTSDTPAYDIPTGTLTVNTQYEITVTATDVKKCYSSLTGTQNVNTKIGSMSWVNDDANIQFTQADDFTQGTLTWNAADTSQMIDKGSGLTYTVLKDGKTVASGLTATVYQFSSDDLVSDTDYTLTVTAVDGNNQYSLISADIQITTGKIAVLWETPGVVIGNVTDRGFDIRWNAASAQGSADTISYDVAVCESATVCTVYTTTQNSYSVSDLSPLVQYNVTVNAYLTHDSSVSNADDALSITTASLSLNWSAYNGSGTPVTFNKKRVTNTQVIYAVMMLDPNLYSVAADSPVKDNIQYQYRITEKNKKGNVVKQYEWTDLITNEQGASDTAVTIKRSNKEKIIVQLRGYYNGETDTGSYSDEFMEEYT
jgi:hypothetical protein